MGEAEIIQIDHAHARPSAGRAASVARRRPSSGRPCRNYAVDDSGYCRVHLGESSRAPSPSVVTHGFVVRRARERRPSRPPGPLRVGRELHPPPSQRRLPGRRLRLRPRAGARGAACRWRSRSTRTTSGCGRSGSSGSRTTGPALLVGNHSGTVAARCGDGAVRGRDRAPAEANDPQHRRRPRLPVCRSSARSRARRATRSRATRTRTSCLRRGELVGVFPEGYKGVGKGWRERYKLQRFGRGGFVEIALRTSGFRSSRSRSWGPKRPIR